MHFRPCLTAGCFSSIEICLHQAPLQGVRAKRWCAGSGERGRMPIHVTRMGKQIPLPPLSESPFVDRWFLSFDPGFPERPTGRSRPQGGTVRHPGIRAAVSRARARTREACLVRSNAEGESRLPRGKAGAPAGRTGAGVNRPTVWPRNAAPTGDCNREGGRGNTGAAAVHKAGKERRFGATPATATPLPSSWKARDPAV